MGTGGGGKAGCTKIKDPGSGCESGTLCRFCTDAWGKAIPD